MNSHDNRSFISFTLTLAIRGINMNFEQLNNKLEIMPTRTYKWNGSIESEKYDAWYYQIKADNMTDLVSASEVFFQKVSGINHITIDRYDMTAEIILHIHSELAQVYFDFPQALMRKLSLYDIPFSISILSWGEVIE